MVRVTKVKLLLLDLSLDYDKLNAKIKKGSSTLE